MRNPCERSSLFLGLGIIPGEQREEVGGTGGTAAFLVLASDSGLKELPALPLTSLVFSWPQDRNAGNSIFLPGVSSHGAMDELFDHICSRWDLCSFGEPSPSGFVGVGLWLRPVGLGGSPHPPVESRRVIHSYPREEATQPSY